MSPTNSAARPLDDPRTSGTPLRTFLTQVEAVLRGGLPERLWIRAAVLAIKATRSGYQLQLGDDEGRLDAFLPQRTLDGLTHDFGPLDPTLLAGMAVLVELAPSFSARWHLQARVLDLGPEVTRSLAALRIERLRATLKAERLFDRQRRLPTPTDVTRVALIHPRCAASHADVAAELRRWEQAGLLAVAHHAAIFEGAQAAADLVAVLAHAASSPILRQPPDLVMLVRGGGSRASLAVLDDETLVRAVCRCPVPVLVGLGHASDTSLVDAVAWRSLDTPSKAVASLGAMVREPARRAIAALSDIAMAGRARSAAGDAALHGAHARALTAARHALDPLTRDLDDRWTGARTAIAGLDQHLGREGDAIHRLLERAAAQSLNSLDGADRDVADSMHRIGVAVRQAASGLDAGAGHMAAIAARALAIAEAQEAQLDRSAEHVADAARRHLAERAADLVAATQAVDRHDVAAVLAQGYALPLDRSGRLVRSRDAARAARDLDILLHDGAVAAVVRDTPPATRTITP